MLKSMKTRSVTVVSGGGGGWGMAKEERGEEREREEVERKNKLRRVKESLEPGLGLGLGEKAAERRGEGVAEENMGAGVWLWTLFWDFWTFSGRGGEETGRSPPLTHETVGPASRSDVVLTASVFTSTFGTLLDTVFSVSFSCLPTEKNAKVLYSSASNYLIWIDACFSWIEV